MKATNADSDNVDSYLEDLHTAYSRGTLRILAGAGVSAPSGIPTWQELSVRIAESYIKNLWRQDGKPVLPEWIGRTTPRRLAEELEKSIGKECIPGLIAGNHRPPNSSPNTRSFLELLAEAVYRDGGAPEARYTSELQFQLASMTLESVYPTNFLYTTNFDPLLEVALAKIESRKKTPNLNFDPTPPSLPWRKFVFPRPQDPRYQKPKTQLAKVTHIHGYLDSDGTSSGDVVLTESDLQAITSEVGSSKSRTMLRALFSAQGHVLILGASLSDLHLRRQLFLRRKEGLDGNGSQVYAMFRSNGSLSNMLVEEALLRSWGVQPLFVEDHWELPGKLRSIQYGKPDDPQNHWTEHARNWTNSHLPSSDFFTDEWQSKAFKELRKLKNFLRTWIAIPREEELHITVFGTSVPPGASAMHSNRIFKIATSRVERKAEKAIEEAIDLDCRVFPDEPTAAAGRAFSQGVFLDSVEDPTIINFGLSRADKSSWNSNHSSTDWRSLYAIPISAGERNLPVAVCTISSNRNDPFWRRMPASGAEERLRIRDYVRSTVLWILMPEDPRQLRPLHERSDYDE